MGKTKTRNERKIILSLIIIFSLVICISSSAILPTVSYAQNTTDSASKNINSASCNLDFRKAIEYVIFYMCKTRTRFAERYKPLPDTEMREIQLPPPLPRKERKILEPGEIPLPPPLPRKERKILEPGEIPLPPPRKERD
jgi:hypothetical protein